MNCCREWDTTQSCRRRDSEPVAPVSGYNFNLPRSRDESYIRALRKFNEWRHKERPPSFRRLSRRSSKKSIHKSYSEQSAAATAKAALAAVHSVMMKEVNTPEEDNNDESHLYEELKTPRRPRPKNLFNSAKKLLQKSQSFPTNNISNCNNNTVQAENTVNVLKSCQKCPVINEHDENEVEEFENNHCVSARQIDLESVRKQSSPPKTFFRDNSNPFPEVRSPIRVNRYNLTSFNQPKQIFSYTNDSIDKFVRESLPKDRDVFSQNRVSASRESNSGSRKYEFNPAAIYENEEKLNQTSQVPMYQTVINRHGDLVEYAIPFNDQNDEEFGDADELRNGDPKFKQVTSNLNASTFPLITDNDPSKDRRASKSLCDLYTYAELRKDRKNIIVTDLDKSDDNPKNKGSVADIIEELETLKNWSKRLSDQSEVSVVVPEEIKGNSLMICSANDISQRTSSLKNTMSGPILLSSGNFRKTSVSLRKIEKRFRIQSEQGLLHDFCILNKVKHPNVALLMAVCLDVNNKILSLVLEPFTTNINSMIYDSDYKIIMEDCIEYILQVIKAVIYLHENGIIHSNICSHNVLVCENKKVVKLSSFELATEVDTVRVENDIIYTFYGDLASYQKSNLKASIVEEGWSSLISKNKIPSQYLPYLIEYRKLYSQHYYQPPELLSSLKHFVFPSRQADVYNIALLLWEMLNSCVPFAIFSYEEIENLFQLNDSNQLPLFDGDRCEIFESLLHNGLITLPNSRIDNVQSMKYLVDEAKVSLKSNSSFEKTIKTSNSSNFVNNSFRKDEAELKKSAWNECARTSTFKRDSKIVDSKYVVECNPVVTKKGRNQSNASKYNSRSLDDILKNDVNTERRKEYGFQIEDFSLPSTPIARKNKLRRNAWLSNKTLYQKSFDESEEDAFERLNNKNDNASSGLKNKLINVNIKIIQNKIDKDEGTAASPEKLQANESSANVSSQIEYWNSIASPSDLSLKKRNNTELSTSNAASDIMRTPDSHIESTCPKEQSTPRTKEQNSSLGQENSKTSLNPPRPAQRLSVRKSMRDRAKYYPNMPELLSETFLRRSKKQEDDFETTLWKREKERCERKSPNRIREIGNEKEGVERPLRASVKDTVYKFESIAKKEKSSRNSSIKSHSDKLLSNSNISSNVSSAVSKVLNDIYMPQSAVISGNYFSLPTADSTTPENDISITKLDVNLSNNQIPVNTPKLQSPNIASTTSAETIGKKTSILNIPLINIESDECKEKLTSTTSIRKTKPTLFSINIRKLNRRASDIGCIRKLAKRENSLRHSICGTDLVRSVAKMNIKPRQTHFVDNNTHQKPVKSVTSLAESEIQHCKLTCWKCGSKVFKLDEIAFNEKAVRTKRFLRRFSTSPVPTTNSTDVSQRIFPASSAEEIKSIEDLYIDDDFECGQEMLGANMRLLSPEQDDLFDILSIDFLSTDFCENIE